MKKKNRHVIHAGFFTGKRKVIIPGAGSDSKIYNLSLSLPGNLSVNPRMIDLLY